MIGSRSAERAAEVCQRLQEAWPGRTLPISGADNDKAAEADLVVVATPWDSASA